MVFAYKTARTFVIPDLAGFQVWITTRDSTKRGRALMTQAANLTQDAALLRKALQDSKPETRAEHRAYVLLGRIAKQTRALGKFVDDYRAVLRETGAATPISIATLKTLGTEYRDAREAWIAVVALAPLIGAQ